MGTLGELIAAAQLRAAAMVSRSAALERSASGMGPVPSLAAALRRPDVALLAEIKRSSPSRGSIRPDLDAAARAAAYWRGGAAAISVLTEPDRFDGSEEDLRAAALASGLPVLKKDFHVAQAQLFEARTIGASAALLIARALHPLELRKLIQAAQRVGLEIVAEVRSGVELDRVLDAGAQIIGVNNRNLETLKIEPGTVESLIPLIPRDCIAIAESGYSDRDSIEAAAACGADAVLIGSSLSTAEDPESAVRRLAGVQRVEREH